MTNTVEFTLRLRAEEFQRSIKAGAAAYRGEIQGLERVTTTGSRRIGDAMKRLGIRPFGDLNSEIRQLRTDYQTLVRSGQLSGRELTRAHVQMQEGVRKLTQEKTGWVQVMGQAKIGMLALAGAGYGVVRMLTAAGGGASEFQTRMAEVFTLIDVSPARFAELTQEVRALAVEMGVVAPAAAQALYDIISAGVPEGNAIEVLRQSTRAAVAGVTDTQSAARVGLAVVNAYGKEIDQLGQVYDVLFNTVKNGVTTLPQLSASLGQALPVAVGAKVPFEELAASIASMTQAGIDTAVASTSIRASITALSTPVPEAKKVMDELGISWNGLFGTLEQIARLNLDPETLRQIVPDVTARTGVLALTRDIDALAGSIESMHQAAGATDEAYAKMADTPEQRMREFRAAMAELSLQIGDLVTAGTPLVEILTRVAQGLNELPTPVKGLLLGITALVAAKAAWVVGLRQVWNALRLASGGLGALANTVPQAITLLGKVGTVALSSGLWMSGLAAAILAVVDAHLKLNKIKAEIEERKRTDQQRLQEMMAEQQEYADLQILTADEMDRLSNHELAAYMKRLQAARDFYTRFRDTASRVHADQEGPTAEISKDLLEIAGQERTFRETFGKVKKLQEQREKSMADHRDAVADIKKDETDKIKKQLTEQLKLYDDANKKLRKAQEIRKQLEQRGKDFEDEFSQPKKQEETPTENSVNVYNQFIRAKDALGAGDFGTATEGAELLEERLRRAREEGTLTATEMKRLAGEVRKIWEGIGEGQEIEATQDLEEANIQIQELVNKAGFLKELEIGFNKESADKSADELRQLLQNKLEKNPIIMPVVLQEPGAPDTRVEKLLENAPRRASGGPIDGPGTETSDSILLWGSKNEYMLRAKAVRHYGLPFIEGINRMLIPKFASGGLVGAAAGAVTAPSIIDNLRLPDVPSVAGSGGGGETPINLFLDGQRFQVSAPANTAEEMKRSFARESLKRGGRVTR